MTTPKDDDDENYLIYEDNLGPSQSNPVVPVQSNNLSSSDGNGSMITYATPRNKSTTMSNTHNDHSRSNLEIEECRHTSSYNWKKDHPKEQVIGDANARVQIRKRLTLE